MTSWKVAVLLSVLASVSSAQVPGIINYQGRVVVNGTNFTGTGQFKFALVDGTGSTTFWSNDGTPAGESAAGVSVTVTKGLYSVLLGQTPMASISPAVFTNGDVRLRVWFDGGNGMQQLSPDQRIGAVGYALMAASLAPDSVGASSLASDPASLAKVSGGALSTPGNNDLSVVRDLWVNRSAAVAGQLKVDGNLCIGMETASHPLVVRKRSLSQPAIMIAGAYAGGPRLQTYGLDADPLAWMGLGTDMAGGSYEHSLYFPAGPYGIGFQTIGSYDGTNYSEKMRITASGKVGIGTPTPIEQLEVAGAVRIGTTANPAPAAGTIRWTGTDFQGYNGSQWLSLTMPAPAGMVRVPGGTLVTLDAETNIVSSFFLCKYEVTYGLWWSVRQWALSNGYQFQNPGREGSEGTNGVPPTESQMLPVTDVNWRDAMVWCNARSEMEGLQAVYAYTNTVIRDSRDANATACDGAVLGNTSDGYRLPKSAEWEYAARYVDDGALTPAMWASGSGNATSDTNACNEVAWFSGNSGGQTHPVGQKKPNQLGIYDMSGNAHEWCWDYLGYWFGSDYRVMRGRDYTEIAWNLFVGGVNGVGVTQHRKGGGFRCARNAP